MKAKRSPLSPTAIAMFESLDTVRQVACLTLMRYAAGKQRFRADRVFTTRAQREEVRRVARAIRENAKARKGGG